MEPLFTLGLVVATMPVVELCRTGLDLGPYFDRHTSGDWGDVDTETKKANDEAASTGGRITSIYHPLGRRIHIVTEADRSRTVVMMPHENTAPPA